MLLKVLFQVIIWFQPNSTKTCLKHRVDWGMLVVRSSVSPCNHYTKGTNLPMLTPRISGLRAASLAGTICFRASQTCTELAQNWERPWKELYRGYKPAESTVPLLMIFQHFAAISTCPPSYWAGHCLCAANQGNAAQNWLSQHGHEPKRSDRGRVVVGSPTVQQHWAHSTGEESCMAVKIFASKDPNWLESPFQNEQDHLREQPGRSRLGSRQTAQGAQGAQSPPSPCLSHLRFSFPQGQGNCSHGTSPSRRNEGCR